MGQRLDVLLRGGADMTTINGWPGKPGVPPHPNVPGAHWLKGYTEDAWMYDGDGGWYGPGYSHQLDTEMVAARYSYLGPVLKPDEVAALQKRVAVLEDLIRVKVTEIERAYPHEGHCIECHGAVRAWGDTEHRDDCWYVKARAALEGKKE